MRSQISPGLWGWRGPGDTTVRDMPPLHPRGRTLHMGHMEPLLPELWHRPGLSGGLLPLPISGSSAMPAPQMEPELTGRCRPATCAPAQVGDRHRCGAVGPYPLLTLCSATAECSWSAWSSWGGCSCSSPLQHRYRHRHGTGLCVGLDVELHPCNTSGCSGEDGDVGDPPAPAQPCPHPAHTACFLPILVTRGVPLPILCAPALALCVPMCSLGCPFQSLCTQIYRLQVWGMLVCVEQMGPLKGC